MPRVVAMGNRYYVSTNGSDSTGVGTYSKPYKTVKKALTKAFAGDTIYIRGGTYKEKVTISNEQGTSSAWITIRAYRTEKVIFDCSSSTIKYDGIFYLKSTCRYIRITGLELKNTKGHGVFLNGNELTNIRIDNCKIHDCESSGIYAYNAKNIEFDNNIVYNVNRGLSYGTTISPQEAISFSNVQGFNIHHNTLSKYGKEGIDCKSGSSNGEIHHNSIDTTSSIKWNHIGIYVDGYTRCAKNVKVYSNNIIGSGGAGVVIGAEKSSGSIETISIYNNIIDLSYSVYRGIDSYYDYPWRNIQIYGNTITVRGSNHPIRIFPSAKNLNGITIKDNIIHGKTSTPIYYQKLSNSEIIKEVVLSNNIYKRI